MKLKGNLVKTLNSLLLVLLLAACDEIATPTSAPTVEPTPTSTPTATVTPTITPTPTLLPFVRAAGDENTFEIGSPEWMAWNYYDATIKYLDYAKKLSSRIGLTAEEQMAVWQSALEKYGVNGNE